MINYQHAFPDAILAQGLGAHVFILIKLEAPYQRADGRRVSYRLDYRWLSCQCETEDDEAYVCVSGNEFTYWSSRELTEIGLFPHRKQIVPDGYVIHDHLSY